MSNPGAASAGETTVVILAAGRGSRMGQLTEARPKCLLDFAGQPLLYWQLRVLAPIADRTVIVSGYQGEQLDGYTHQRIKNDAWETTNMVFSLMCAREVFERSERLVVSYADIVFERHVVDSLLHANAPFSTVVDRDWLDLWSARFDDPLSDAETMEFGASGNIVDLGRKASDAAQIQGQYIGLSCLQRDGIEAMLSVYDDLRRHAPELDPRNCYITDLLRTCIGAGISITPAFINRGWLEFDSPEDLRSYEAMQADGTLDRFWSPERT